MFVCGGGCGRALSSLELVVSDGNHMSDGNPTWVLWASRKLSLTPEPQSCWVLFVCLFFYWTVGSVCHSWARGSQMTTHGASSPLLLLCGSQRLNYPGSWRDGSVPKATCSQHPDGDQQPSVTSVLTSSHYTDTRHTGKILRHIQNKMKEHKISKLRLSGLYDKHLDLESHLICPVVYFI